MKTLDDYSKAGQELYHKLHLATYPIAIKYIKVLSEIPEGIMRPSARGQKWSLCQAFAYTRRWAQKHGAAGQDPACSEHNRETNSRLQVPARKNRRD